MRSRGKERGFEPEILVGILEGALLCRFKKSGLQRYSGRQ